MKARKQVFEGNCLANFVVLQPVMEREVKVGGRVLIFDLHDVLSQIAGTVNTMTHTKPGASSYLSLDNLIVLQVDNFFLLLTY